MAIFSLNDKIPSVCSEVGTKRLSLQKRTTLVHVLTYYLFFSIVPLLSNFSLHQLALNILVYCSWCCGCIAVVYIVYLGLKIDFPKDRFIGKRCYALHLKGTTIHCLLFDLT